MQCLYHLPNLILIKIILTSISNNSSTKYKIKKVNIILLDKNINNLVNNPENSNLEMVDRKRDKNYIRKGIRISLKHIIICDFLDFFW